MISASKPFKPHGKISQTHWQKILLKKDRFLMFDGKLAIIYLNTTFGFAREIFLFKLFIDSIDLRKEH